MNAKLLLLIPLVMLATGCQEEDSDDLNAWMQETQQRAKANLTPPKAPEPVIPAQYTTPAPINPHAFHLYRMRPMSPTVSTANAPNLNRPKELLENVPLTQLKFVGTIGSGNKLSALISVDNKQVYTVNLGNYLGHNYGRVVKITPDEITLRETVEDAEGNWTPRQTILVLGETPEAEKK